MVIRPSERGMYGFRAITPFPEIENTLSCVPPDKVYVYLHPPTAKSSTFAAAESRLPRLSYMVVVVVNWMNIKNKSLPLMVISIPHTKTNCNRMTVHSIIIGCAYINLNCLPYHYKPFSAQ